VSSRHRGGLCSTAIAHQIHKFSVLLIVAVDTQQLPVATISRVIVVIMVNMMNGKFGQALASKLPGTASSTPLEELERLLPIALGALGIVCQLFCADLFVLAGSLLFHGYHQ
jgi:hypothetical protein